MAPIMMRIVRIMFLSSYRLFIINPTTTMIPMINKMVRITSFISFISAFYLFLSAIQYQRISVVRLRLVRTCPSHFPLFLSFRFLLIVCCPLFIPPNTLTKVPCHTFYKHQGCITMVNP